MKIVVAQNLDLTPDQIERIKLLGEVKIYDDPKSAQEWLERCQDAEIVCSVEEFMKTEVYKLENKFFTIPMVGYSWLDIEKLKERNITLANCPGCNKYAVAEWIVAMTINLLRDFPAIMNTDKAFEEIGQEGVGLKNKKITILGKGNIGSLVGKFFGIFGAKVDYFQENDDLLEKTKDAGIIVNCMSTNPTTIGLLNRDFFLNLKKGVYFISVTTTDLYDNEALAEALASGTIAGMANDCASAVPRDTSDSFYKRFSSYPKVLATPHIAFFTDASTRDENDMMIDNIEAWIKGKPENIVEPNS